MKKIGYIKSWRKTEDNEIFKNPKNALLYRTWQWLLWNANRFKKGDINIGELLITYEEISFLLNVSIATINRHMKDLEDMNLIYKYHYKLNTRILIRNYEKYQVFESK
jgi:DNA-binding transcriptional ArsR family regulator